MEKFKCPIEPKEMSAGSNADMTLAYIVRGVMIALLLSLVYCFVGIRDDMRDIKREWPEMKKDIGELKEQGKTFATQKQLEAAEQRVKQEFAEELKKARVITSTQGK